MFNVFKAKKMQKCALLRSEAFCELLCLQLQHGRLSRMLEDLYLNLIHTPKSLRKICCLTCGEAMKLILVSISIREHSTHAYHCDDCRVTENFIVKNGTHEEI